MKYSNIKKGIDITISVRYNYSINYGHKNLENPIFIKEKEGMVIL